MHKAHLVMLHISVILTGAQTLLNSDMRCPEMQLECQVSGARVCVDSLTACDGVPNCGSYDIYDEDRLMCGVGIGLQHNVYLAAFTFLAVLLTLCYGVHYWLKRCVPTVAEAFFVYTDGIENILFLDTIMRPPGDNAEEAKMFYHGNMFGEDNTELNRYPTKRNIFSRLLSRIFFCFRKKEELKSAKQEHELQGSRQTYSFTQMELSKMQKYRPTVDTSVQTGDSLEIAIYKENTDVHIKKNKSIKYENIEVKTVVYTKDHPIMINDSLLTLDEPLPEDLSLIKFFRSSRSNSSESIIKTDRHTKHNLDFETGAAPDGEIELSNIIYEKKNNVKPRLASRGDKAKPGTSGVKAKTKSNPKVSSQIHKRIRFQENTTTIPSQDFDINVSEEEEKDKHPVRKRQLMSLRRTRPRRNNDLSTIKEDDESGTKHKHFWDSKGPKKKSKNKASTLRLAE